MNGKHTSVYLLTHKTLVTLKFCHNHFVHSAHGLSFVPVSEETKQRIFSLFYKGHNAASARHAYEAELMLECAERGTPLQPALADRSINPLAQDYSRLFAKWRCEEMGSDDNGPLMFEKLQEVVDEYNSSSGGRASLQVFERYCESADCDSTQDEPKQKRRKLEGTKPMILTICTPLMMRASATIQQAGEMIFCDSTSTLDRLNTSMFILSTSTPASGVPLGVMVTSDEQQSTIKRGLEMLAELQPEKAFNGKGASQGPDFVMIDDSSTERGAFKEFWPDTTMLMCTFHFLQCRWTWLLDGKNRILHDDRIILIQKVKDLVYAKTTESLKERYQQFLKSPEVLKYPNFLNHVKSLWDRRLEWAHCYRASKLVRGNHTNNYAEAGMRILKELIFGRVKAYNMVQMFQFVTEIMERYYQSKLLSIAHSRVDRYISLRYQGLNSKQYAKDSIVQIQHGIYSVPSKTERGIKHWVDMNVGQCTCEKGRDGSPCSHQAAIVLYFGSPSVNCIPVMDPKGKQTLAYIAHGEDAVQDLSFYCTIAQSLPSQPQDEQADNENLEPDFSTSYWELIRTGASSDAEPGNESDEAHSSKESKSLEALSAEVDSIADDIKKNLQNEQFANSVKKFVSTYRKLSSKPSNASLISSLHRFGWCFGGTVTTMKNGILRHGRRIPIQAKSAGRRKGGKRGKAAISSGRRPKTAFKSVSKTEMYKYSLPGRAHNNSTKRPHSLQQNISRSQQNAGKW